MFRFHTFLSPLFFFLLLSSLLLLHSSSPHPPGSKSPSLTQSSALSPLPLSSRPPHPLPILPLPPTVPTHPHPLFPTALDPLLSSLPPPLPSRTRLKPSMSHHVNTPDIVTLNVTSLSIDQTGASCLRAKACDRMIAHLVDRFDHVCLQEVKCASERALKSHFNALLPNAFPVTAPLSQHSSGVTIITHRRVLHHYIPTPTYPTGASKGRVLSVLFTPKPDFVSTHPPYRVTCVYFGDVSCRVNARVEHISSVTSLPTSRIHYLCGDFNTVFHPDDRSSGRIEASTLVKNAFEAMLARHGLEELYQPTHTFYTNLRGGPSSSRLDRFYVSIGMEQLVIAPPEAYIPQGVPLTLTSLPPSKVSDDDRRYVLSLPPASEGKEILRVTPHIPVAMRMSYVPKGQSGRTTIPHRVLKDPEFLSSLRDKWSRTDKARMSSFATLQALNKAIRDSAKAINKKHCGAFSPNRLSKVDKVTRALDAAYRRFCAPDDIFLAADNDVEVVQMFDWGARDVHSFTVKARDFLREASSPDSETDLRLPQLSRSGRLSKLLPRYRPKITFLQDDCRTTTDPARMTAIAHHHWRNKWERKPPRFPPSTLLRHYNKRIMEPLATLDLELVEEVILASNNSSPGPDGIPFSVYRDIVDISGPVLLSCVSSMINGDADPPDAFNSGLLYLIPKKSLGVIEDTRPIVVSNADNRLIASILRALVAAPLADLISIHQKGFLPGRRMDDHIMFFNEAFFGACERKEDYDLLLFDFAKAFDSCDHDVIFHLLEHVGIPQGVVGAIRLLFRNAHCLTTFPGTAPARIDFARGIKQGCPLSPLLFILLMDVLMTFLQTVEGIDPRMYADDTAAGSLRMNTLTLGRIKKIFEFFEDGCGLGLNLDKTFLLTTRTPRSLPTLHRRLSNVGWGNIKVSVSEKYLGILIGAGVDFGDDYWAPFTKFLNRLTSYQPFSSNLSTTSKIHTVNTFLTPLLSLPLSYFPFPTNYTSRFSSVVSRFAVTAKSIAFLQLCRPRRHLGLPVPLIHPFYWSIALQAARWDGGALDPSHDRARCWELSNSRRISHHVANAVSTCGRLGVKDAVVRSGAPSKIYQAFMDSEDLLPDFVSHYTTALLKWGLKASQVPFTVDHYAKAPRWVPDYVLETFIKLVHNALPTAKRLSHLHRPGAAKLPHLPPTMNCVFCGQGDGDDVFHYFSHCPAVRSFLKGSLLFFGTLSTPHPISSTDWTATVLLVNAASPLRTAITSITIFAVWRLRECLRGGTVVNNRSDWVRSTVIDKVMGAAPHVMSTVCFPHNLFPAALVATATAAVRGFGSSSSRSPAQAAAARIHAAALVTALPGNCIQIWTDGSALGNPGPAGAGAVVVSPDGTQVPLSAALGSGSNNFSELWAIGMGLDWVSRRAPSPPPDQIHVFSDSEIAIGVCARGWYSKEYHYLGSAIRSLTGSLVPKVVYHKVAGHADVPLNEVADRLAKKGALASKAGELSFSKVFLRSCLQRGGFSSLILPRFSLPPPPPPPPPPP
jgi:ribonuclease HI/exonuclease III